MEQTATSENTRYRVRLLWETSLERSDRRQGRESVVNPVSGLMAYGGVIQQREGTHRGRSRARGCWPPQHEMGTERKLRLARKKIQGQGLLIHTVHDETRVEMAVGQE